MAVQERVSRVTLTLATGVREWVATAAQTDVAAGGTIVWTVTETTTGALPPTQPDALSLTLKNDASGIVRTVALTPGSPSQQVTVHMNSTGASGGTARSGVLEGVIRAQRTTGLAAQNYDVSSDGSTATPPTAGSVATDRGWTRGTTTAVVSTSNVSAGGAKPAVYAYTAPATVGGSGGDSVFHRVVLGAAPFTSGAATRTVGAVLSSTVPLTGGAATHDVTFAGVVDDRWPASSSAQVATVAVGNSSLTGQPWTVLTSLTTDTLTVDPRLTVTHLFQLDDDQFAAPPMGSHDPGKTRTMVEQAFLGTRLANARDEGVVNVRYDWTLTPSKPGTAVTSVDQDTTTRGGEAGWGPTLVAWSSTLPTGAWTKTVTVDAVSADVNGTTGAEYLVGATDAYTHAGLGAGSAPVLDAVALALTGQVSFR